jgi:hypothetical protein
MLVSTEQGDVKFGELHFRMHIHCCHENMTSFFVSRTTSGKEGGV